MDLHQRLSFSNIGNRMERLTSAQRGYGYRWQKARLRHLAQHPLCVKCEAKGRVTVATVVDHIIPHKGDLQLFWDETNWQSLCKPHHDRDKQSEERGGTKRTVQIGADGWPQG